MPRSAPAGVPARPIAWSHENHETNFMMLRIRPRPRRRNIKPSTPSLNTIFRSLFNMKWETPQAIDLRFGMEITMYIANR
jgi:coenzyme PQQ precursor peptide PqqA